MNRQTLTRLAALLPLLALAVGIALPQAQDDVALADQLAQELLAACPVTAPDDEKARDVSADRLARSDFLRERMSEPFFWGPHLARRSYDPAENSVTRFHPF